VDHGADVNLASNRGWDALHMAAHQGKVELVTLLCNADAVVDSCTPESRWTALQVATFNGHTAVVRALLRAHADCNYPMEYDRYQVSPLFVAAMSGDMESAQELLGAGAMVDMSNVTIGKLGTPLHAAASEGHTRMVEMLIAAGASLEILNSEHESPLGAAAFMGHGEVVHSLLRAGAVVDSDRFARPPLLLAISSGSLLAVQALCVYGAKRSSITCPITSSNSSESVCEWWRSTASWSTPLHYVAFHSVARTRALLRDGADPNAGQSGSTPLTIAKRVCAAAKKPNQCDSARLLLRAAEPWSPHNHDLFPHRVRARAVSLFMIGELLQRSQRFDGKEQAIKDVWVFFVMPHALESERVQATQMAMRTPV
jgi:ankyrin repeat protein